MASLALLGIALTFVACTLAWVVATPEGRNVTAALVLEQLSGEIVGEITVAHVSEIGLTDDGLLEVSASGIRAIDERGVAALDIERGRVALDIGAALGGDIRFPRAWAEGGRVRIAERGDGTVGIDAAFRGTAPPGGGGGPNVTFDDVDAHGVVVEIRPRSGPAAILDGVHGHVAVQAGGDGAATMRFWAARGEGHLLNPIAIDARIVRADGSFDGDARTRLRCWVNGEIAGERLDARLALREEGDGVRMHVETDSHGPIGWLLGLGIDIAGG